MSDAKDFSKGFKEHGIAFISQNGNNLCYVCPFCDKKKLYLNQTNGLWECKACGETGNFSGFLSRMSVIYQRLLPRHAEPLCKKKGLKLETLQAWGVGYNPAMGFYSFPESYDGKKVTNIQRYTLGDNIARATACGEHSLLRPISFPASKRVWIAEGLWDGCSLYEITGGKEEIWAVPGAGTFPLKAAALFEKKSVYVPFDNDDAGKKGMYRLNGIISGAVKDAHWIQWPKTYADGFDVRDLWQKILRGNSPKTLERLLSLMSSDIPQKPGQVKNESEETKEEKPKLEVATREQLIIEYRKWLDLPDTEIIDIIYGCIFSNRLGLDPLWVFIVDSPGGGKTELLMPMGEGRGIITTTTLTPKALISGASTAAGDPSLIPKLNGKVLIVKDFTTILSMNQLCRDEIFGVLRDAYDGKIEKYIGNGVHRKYNSRFGILAGVTPVIEAAVAGNAVLGERFLKYRNKRFGALSGGRNAILSALANVGKEKDMRATLANLAERVLERDVTPEEIPPLTTHYKERIATLAQFVAALRGVVSRDKYTGVIYHKPVQEIGTRLAKQLACLCIGISVFKREKTISEKTFLTCASVARDTVPDRTEEIVRTLYMRGKDESLSLTDLARKTRFPDVTVQAVMDDLILLRIVQKEKTSDGMRAVYKLSSTVRKQIDTVGLFRKEVTFAEEMKGVKK